MTSRYFNLERITAGLLLILGIAVIIDSRKLDYWTTYGPGAGFFPFWCGIAVIATSLYLLLKGVDGPVLTLSPGMKKLLLFVSVFCACIVILPYLGWLITFTLFVSVLLQLISEASIATTVKITVMTMLFIQVVFSNLLKVPLPTGILTF
jgi:hypothetical protein